MTINHLKKVQIWKIKTLSKSVGVVTIIVVIVQLKKAKGNTKSYEKDKIISYIKKIYDPSKTLVLVADDCGSYGFDINSNLIEIIYEIYNNYPDCTFDINFISPSYLQKHSNELIALFRKVNVESFRMPLQSGSNKVLKKMRRYYDVKK